MSEIIVAQNLTKKFGSFTAVDDISFGIRRGECFGFLGPNGAGKTTTVKMIHCVSPLTAGSITVDGLPAGLDNRQIKYFTGVIPQENLLDSDLTVHENLIVFAELFDIPKAEARRRVAELLVFMELDQKANSKVDDLSTGLKRRLMIARALLNKPKIIIADEPTTGLDPQARHLIWQRLRQLKTQGVTIVLTTQYMEEAQQLCDRLVIMFKGKILKEGQPGKLVDEVVGRDVFELRLAPERDAAVLQALSGADFTHERVGDTLYIYGKDGKTISQRVFALDLPNVLHRPASLEDVFLKLTGRGLIE